MAKYDWNPWEVLGGAGGGLGRASEGVACRLVQGGSEREPLADVVETREAFVLVIELPGIVLEEISLDVTGREIAIFVAPRQLRDADGSVYHIMERAHGALGRRFLLPQGVDSAAVTAVLDAGLLTVTVPKRRGGRTSLQIEVED